MSSILLKNIKRLATMDDQRRELSDASILIRDNVIAAVDDDIALSESEAHRVIDLSGHVVLPGLVNTHHHMYQCLTRVMGQDSDLFGWLKACYPVWGTDARRARQVRRQAGYERIAVVRLYHCQRPSLCVSQ